MSDDQVSQSVIAMGSHEDPRSRLGIGPNDALSGAIGFIC